MRDDELRAAEDERGVSPAFGLMVDFAADVQRIARDRGDEQLIVRVDQLREALKALQGAA